MSILRLSCSRATLFAPDDRGMLVDTPYDPAVGTGRLDTLAERDIAPDIADATSPLGVHLDQAISQRASALPEDQPVVVLLHGFLFDPYHIPTADPKESDNAHARLYHFQDHGENDEIRYHTTGWPLWLGFDPADATGASGLALAFCWHSKPGLAASLLERFENHYARAYDYGTETAWALANVLNLLAAHPALAGRPIDIFCHSLGSHVITRAVALGCKHAGVVDFVPRLGRVIFLGGAEYVVEAQLMYRRIMQAGLADAQGPTFYNIGCRENDVLDKLGENFGPRTFGNTNVIGHNGLDLDLAERWIDFQIDSSTLRKWMIDSEGLDISGDEPGTVWDHWYYYTHRGNMSLYRGILRDRKRWTIPSLRRKVGTRKPIPEGITRGWFGD
jgi:hypothetical protein